MYVDKIPNEYVVSKFCTSITNISCKNKIIYQKEHQFITYLSLACFSNVFVLRYNPWFG